MPTSIRLENPELAVCGGRPVRDKWLPYGKQSISAEDIEAVTEVLKSDWLTQGPKIVEFEQALADLTGVRHAVAVNNGTAALHCAYYAAGIGDDDEVLMPGMSFAATANAALYLGARPVFVDVDKDTGNVAPDEVRRAITKRTKAIVGVDFTGHPCDLVALKEIADAHGIPFIVDGAHSLGSLYDGRPAAQFADLTTYSFHPVKTVTTGEGGAIVTSNGEFARRMRIFRTHGIEKAADRFVNRSDGPWYHEMQILGFNYRLTDMQAALGTSQLRRLAEFVKRRRELAELYRTAIAPMKHFSMAKHSPRAQSAYHLFVILVNDEPHKSVRKLVVEALHAENIGVQIHYIPIYRHPYYQQLPSMNNVHCPNTDEFYERVISLPIFPDMTRQDINDVVAALHKIDAAL